jgi:hypothetical protein
LPAQEQPAAAQARAQPELAQASPVWPVLLQPQQAEDLKAGDLAEAAQLFRQPRASPRHRR